MRATCVFAVASLMTSCLQISGLRDRARAARTPRARAVSARRWPAVAHSGRGGCWRANSSITARVTAGARSASPRATILHGGGDLLGRRVFEHEPARAGAQRVVDVGVEPERGQDQHTCAGCARDDAAGRLDSVEHRHTDVHQHDVGPQTARLGDRILAVACLADDVGSGSASRILRRPTRTSA